MDQFSNSHASKNYNAISKKTGLSGSGAEEKAKPRIKPVVHATVKKKSAITRFSEVFLADDLNSVVQNLVSEVLIPAIKRTASELIKNGSDMLIWGESRKTANTPFASRVSYTDYFQPNRQSSVDQKISWDQILFSTRSEAEAVLVVMKDIIDRYGTASIANLYELADISTTNYTLNRYGWKSLDDAFIKPTPSGYIIKFPRPIQIN